VQVKREIPREFTLYSCKLKTTQRGIPLNVDTEGITITVILLPPYSMYFKTRLPYKNAEIKGKSFIKFEKTLTRQHHSCYTFTTIATIEYKKLRRDE